MSQFLLAILKERPVTKVENISFVKAVEAQSVFSDVVDYFGIDPTCAWAVLDESGDTTDSIFACAGMDLSQGDLLSSTRLGTLLGELLKEGAGLVAWYANDYKQLEEPKNVIELIEYLNKELPVGSGEVYFEYR
jgi:hypothetical protein